MNKTARAQHGHTLHIDASFPRNVRNRYQEHELPSEKGQVMFAYQILDTSICPDVLISAVLLSRKAIQTLIEYISYFPVLSISNY